MAYKIKTISDISQVDKGQVAQIDVYNWGGKYKPKALGILCYIKDQGFILRMRCIESNPTAKYIEQNKPVCRDSCLVFFVNFKPQNENSGYINFECNALGSLLCAYGNSVFTRNTIVSMGLEHPNVESFNSDTEWGFDIFIPLTLISGVYNNADFNIGDSIRGNFYKCGDSTKEPHYGSFTMINVATIPAPSFHQPNFFAEMVIVD